MNEITKNDYVGQVGEEFASWSENLSCKWAVRVQIFVVDTYAQ